MRKRVARKAVVCCDCGKSFMPRQDGQMYCHACSVKRHIGGTWYESRLIAISNKRIASVNEAKRRAVAERLAARDAEYAAAFPELATGARRGRVPVGGMRKGGDAFAPAMV